MRTAPTVKDLSDRFMVEHSEARNKPSTVRGNRTTLTVHVLPAMGKIKVADVKRSDVVGRLRGRPTAANHCLSLLRKMFNLAKLWGMRPDGSNPCRHIKKYTGSKRTRLITDEELTRLYAYLDRADMEGLEHPILNGICSSAVELLKDTVCPGAVFDQLRRMVPGRQIEAAELMIGQNNFSVVFAKALLVATPERQLVELRKPKLGGTSAVAVEQIARMERELASLQMQVKSVEETYSVDNLHLTVAKGYVAKLLNNARIVRWLSTHRQEYLGEFQPLRRSVRSRSRRSRQSKQYA